MATFYAEKEKSPQVMGTLGFSPVKIIGDVVVKQGKYLGYSVPDTKVAAVKNLLNDQKIDFSVVKSESLQLALSPEAELLSEGRGISLQKAKTLSKAVLQFLDAAGTAMGRATHYNTKEEQAAAELYIHNELLSLDRGLYGLLLTIDGNTEHSIITGVKNLLKTQRKESTLLSKEQEINLLGYLSTIVSVPRELKLFFSLTKKGERVNNKKTRRLIWKYVLGSDNIEFWSVKYRKKLKAALTHSWGVRMTMAIKNILSKIPTGITLSEKENKIIEKYITRHCHRTQEDKVVDCVSFILGNENLRNPSVELLHSYIGAKTNINEGRNLPMQTLEGIRSVFHKDTVTHGQVMELTKKQFTEKEKMQVQEQAKRHSKPGKKIKVSFNPMAQTIENLYIYAYDQGMTREINDAITAKAKKIAQSFPVKYRKIAVVLDASRSMFGEKTQKLKPMASSLAIKDILMHVAEETTLFMAGGKHRDGLIEPASETNIASSLLDAFESEPQAIFVITDGYENAPAGRVNELMSAVRKTGNEIPVYQLSPVMAAESDGIKSLSEDFVPKMPVGKPEGIGVALLKSSLQADPARGIVSLIKMADARARLLT